MTLTNSPRLLALFLAIAVPTLALRWRRWRRRRVSKLPPNEERVLVLGATSGIGRAIAEQYASRAAKVCVVGRRPEQLEDVKASLWALQAADRIPPFLPPVDQFFPDQPVLALSADFTSATDVVRVRNALKDAWGGIDTVVVCAGVSALRPLLEVAGVAAPGQEAGVEDVQRTVDVANAALRGNFTGPLVSAVSLIPLLESSSKHPAIVLISSLAAIVPAPTRSLYCASKASSLILYQALSLEHPKVAFTHIIPATVEGNFRASAVDGGPVRESDPNKHGLKRHDVAKRTIRAVDGGEKTVFMPFLYGRAGHLLYWLLPAITEYGSRKKYNYPLP